MHLVFTKFKYVINDWHCYYDYGYCYYCSPSVVLPILNRHFKSCWTQAECDLFQISQVSIIEEAGGEIFSRSLPFRNK